MWVPCKPIAYVPDNEFKCIFILVGASAVSGFFASACSLPFDYVKTQIQKMQPDANGKYPYTGSLDCAMKTLKSGGPFKFYTGFPVYCVRIAPHVMVIPVMLSLYLYNNSKARIVCFFVMCYDRIKAGMEPAIFRLG